jgi:hypothetical protein
MPFMPHASTSDANHLGRAAFGSAAAGWAGSAVCLLPRVQPRAVPAWPRCKTSVTQSLASRLARPAVGPGGTLTQERLHRLLWHNGQPALVRPRWGLVRGLEGPLVGGRCGPAAVGRELSICGLSAPPAACVGRAGSERRLWAQGHPCASCAPLRSPSTLTARPGSCWTRTATAPWGWTCCCACSPPYLDAKRCGLWRASSLRPLAGRAGGGPACRRRRRRRHLLGCRHSASCTASVLSASTA